MSNLIITVFPYWAQGTWVFDDAAIGLVQEPFVYGIPEIIDILVKDIPEASKGFQLLGSAHPFPGYQAYLVWNREEYGGNWYTWPDAPEGSMEGWLCPALFKYFDTAPAHLYVNAQPLRARVEQT